MTTEKVTGKRNLSRPIKILAISLISLILTFAVLLATAFIICNAVFARREDNDTFRLDYSEFESDYPRRELHFESGANTLVGYLYSAKSPVGLVLIAHGMRNHADSHLAETMFFVENGWSVFAFDGTGVGDSGGDSTVGLSQMALDLRAAMTMLGSHPETAELPLVLYGHSMGGYAATVAAEDGGAEAVVSIAGFDSPMQLMLDFGLEFVGGVAYVGYPFLYLQNLMTFGEYADRRAVDAINASDASFLIVYGTDDDVVGEAESIYGKREEIKNPDVSYILIDDPNRNAHSTAWLSGEAAARREAFTEHLESLRDDNGELPVGVLGKSDDIEFFELDLEFMNTVLEFFAESIK